MVLGSQLRRLRESKGITREDAGYSIRGSGSKISRLELGRVGFKERDVVDLLTLYGVDDPTDRQAFLELVHQSNQPGWWHRYNDLTPSWFTDYIGLEESAARIQTYEIQFVPGLLQTEGYARAVISGGDPDRVGPDVERRVAIRMRRQRLLAHPKAPRLWAVLEESLLHRTIGDAKVMREQIDHLLDMTRLPNIALQIVPLNARAHPAEGPFALLRFTEQELPDIVYLEHLTGALYLDRPEDVEIYSRVANQIAVLAQTPDASRRTLERLRDAL